MNQDIVFPLKSTILIAIAAPLLAIIFSYIHRNSFMKYVIWALSGECLLAFLEGGIRMLFGTSASIPNTILPLAA